MTIELISKEEYAIISGIQERFSALTFQNKGFEYIDKRKFTDDEAEAFNTVEEILRKHITGFSEFNNFQVDKNGDIRIRFQYDWDADNYESPIHFIGVGYIKLNELLNGFEK